MSHRIRFAGMFAGASLIVAGAVPLLAQSASHPTPAIEPSQLTRMKGPKKPAGATHLGKQEQPMVGDVKLPIQNVDVYQFPVRTQRGLTVPVNWAYVPGQGTFMWANAPIQCAEGTVIPNGSYAMRIKDDGSGGYLLGTDRCQTGSVYGCQFNASNVETTCGVCAWSSTEVVCAGAN